MTKREYFTQIKTILEDMGKDELVMAMAHELELLDKKNSNRAETATQKANKELKAVIVEVLGNAEKPVTVTELQNLDTRLSVTNYTNQKISALLNQLVEDKVLVKVVDKKKSYFSIATE